MFRDVPCFWFYRRPNNTTQNRLLITSVKIDIFTKSFELRGNCSHFLSTILRFWALFEHFLAIFASFFLGFYERNREKPSRVTLSKCHPSTQWLARVHHVVVFKTKVLHLKIEHTAIKDTNGKRKFKRMLSFLMIRYDIVFRGIQPCFLRIGALGLFWTKKAPRFPWGHLRYIPYSMIKQNYVFKREFLHFKGFMDGFYILTSAWKKNHKICIWNWFFAMCSTDLTCVNATI